MVGRSVLDGVLHAVRTPSPRPTFLTAHGATVSSHLRRRGAAEGTGPTEVMLRTSASRMGSPVSRVRTEAFDDVGTTCTLFDGHGQATPCTIPRRRPHPRIAS